MPIRNPIEPDRVGLPRVFPNGIDFKLVTEDGEPFIYLIATVPHRNGSGRTIQIKHRSAFLPPNSGDAWSRMNLAHVISEAFKSFVRHEVLEHLTFDGKLLHDPHREGDEDPSMWHPIRESNEPVSDPEGPRRLSGMKLEITSDSHTDHGLTPAHLDWLTKAIEERNPPEGVSVLEFEIPPHLSPLETALVSDVPESLVYYAIRGKRKCASRLVDRPLASTRICTAIVGPNVNIPFVLYTAYGGPAAPREPGDPDLVKEEDWKASKAFWSTHALATGKTPG